MMSTARVRIAYAIEGWRANAGGHCPNKVYRPLAEMAD